MEHINDGRQPTVTTYTGISFNLVEPEFNILDIAHALSNICRYNGHCNQFYSVAEHSVLVSRLVEELQLGDPFIGLMHDGHEAYLSDVPSPFKQLLPDWSAIDVALEEKLYDHFSIPWPREDGIKYADVLAYFIERDCLFDEWKTNKTYLAEKYPEMQDRATDLLKQGWEIDKYLPWRAHTLFLERYYELQKQTRED